MKRLFLVLVILVLASPAFAGGEKSMIGRVWSQTTGVTGVSLTSGSTNFDWTYGFKILVYGSADDTITVAVTAGDGLSQIYSGTTSTANSGSGEWLNMGTVPIPPGATITISGIGSGTANVIFTAARY